MVIFEPRAEFVLTVLQLAEEPPGAGVNYEPSFQGQRSGCFGGNDQCRTQPAVAPPAYPGCR